MTKALELMKKLNEAEDKAAELRKKLTSSLLIQSIWPEAFDHGTCKTKFRKLQPKSKKIGAVSTEYEGFLERPDGTTFPLTDKQVKEILNVE